MFQVSMLKYILIRSTSFYHCCAVITDAHIVARIDDTLTGFPSIYHVDCEVIVDSLNTQALRVINSTCANVSKGNCRGYKSQPVDTQKENNPLPKRKYKHK